MKKNISRFFLMLFFSASLLLPLGSAYAVWTPGKPLVPCYGVQTQLGKSGATGEQAQKQCDFDALVLLAQNIMTFLLWLAVAASVLLFAYAGILYMTSAGDMSKVQKAHKIFTNLAIGVIIMGVAWLFVYVFTEALINPNFKGYLFFLRS